MQVKQELTLDDFDFSLPPELIAQYPLAERTASRLLHVASEGLQDLVFGDLEQLLVPGDLLVFNDTRVVKARLLGVKPTGGRVEALIERVIEPTLALAMVRTSHKPQPGAVFLFDALRDDVRNARHNPRRAVVEGRRDDFFLLRFDTDVTQVMDECGRVPLPPYIAHSADTTDAERYQTVYAAHPGAVAAPTAGLHFDEAMMARLRDRGVEFAALTLHVGAGTFQPVRSTVLAAHRMHGEWFDISAATAAAVNGARAAGRRVIAVGTTSLRALESAGGSGILQPETGETRLFVTPGYPFRIVDALVTNFHLPKSTLMMLVSAFAGLARIRAAYAHAVERRYRFFSYGDAMFLERAE
jgi:S-adenosylmethionine:tRNA ribosyltransferase-isomerase